MKKMILMAAVALSAATFSFATATETFVETQTVGYTKTAVETAKWYQIATPFEVLNSTAPEGKVKINEAYSTGFEAGDLLYIYDSSAGGYGETSYTWEECYFDDDDNYLDNPVTGWGVSQTLQLKATVNVGQSVFVKKEAASSNVLFLGSVSDTLVSSFGAVEGNVWAQIAYPYPVSTGLNDMTWTGLESGDLLYVYDSNAGGYSTTSYTWEECYFDASENYLDIPVMGWGVSQTLTGDVIVSGTGLFINKISTGVGTLSR